MRDIKARILCSNCPVYNAKIKEEGERFRVEYVVMLKPGERYLIHDNTEVSWDEVMKNIREFNITYVPKFGKYEIEEFVGDCMRQAIFFSKDITDLFNMELLCDDFPYNETRVTSATIKERVLKCFEIVKKEKNITYLKFKWQPYNLVE